MGALDPKESEAAGMTPGYDAQVEKYEARGASHATALILAARSTAVEAAPRMPAVIRLLLDNAADVKATNREGHSALIEASGRGADKIVEKDAIGDGAKAEVTFQQLRDSPAEGQLGQTCGQEPACPKDVQDERRHNGILGKDGQRKVAV